MRLRHAVEILVFYALLAALNYFLFPQYPGFVDVDPSPYWLGILLFGFRYGIWAGFVSGLFSAALYFGFAWTGLERYLFEDFPFYFLPSLFVVGGVLIGVGVYQYRLRIQSLEQKGKEMQADLGRAAEELRTLREINAGLEKRIVTRMQTLVTLYEGARSLSVTDLEALYPAILHFVMKAVDATEAAIYVKVDTDWKLKVNAGWQAYENHPTTLKAGEGLTGIAGAGNKIVSIRDFINSSPKADFLADCMVAGPIRKGTTGEVVAVLAIQDLPFLSFTSATVNLLAFLLDWASRAMGQAVEMGELREREIWDPVYNVFSQSYFKLRAGQELLRSKTYYLPLSLGVVRVEGLDPLTQSAETQLLQMIAQVLRDSCRDMDVVARNEDPHQPFTFLLITASATQAEEIRRRILDNFSNLKLSEKGSVFEHVRIHVGVSHFSPKTTSIDEMAQVAQLDSANSANRRSVPAKPGLDPGAVQ